MKRMRSQKGQMKGGTMRPDNLFPRRFSLFNLEQRVRQDGKVPSKLLSSRLSSKSALLSSTTTPCQELKGVGVFQFVSCFLREMIKKIEIRERYQYCPPRVLYISIKM
jgi:hypothetical protein